MTDAQILECATKIKEKQSREEREKKEKNTVNALQKMVGKYFKTLDYGEDKKEFYRVFHDNWRDSQVKIERWKYYHNGYYQIALETWYADNRRLYDEEITEIEFLQAVSWWMKKVGVHQILTTESDH